MLARTYSTALLQRIRPSLIRLGYHSKPSFLIIGAQKSGTTALYYYLANHPNLISSSEKEIGFFTPELFEDWPQHPNQRILCSWCGTDFFDPRTYPKMAAWYHSHFPLPHELARQGMTYEATPEYLYYPEAAERIFKYDPQMKIIAILRDPVERAFSAWNMYSNFGEGKYRPLTYASRRETRGFDKAVHDEIKEIDSRKSSLEPGYVRRGLYYEQILRYFRLFRRDQILILNSRALKDNTRGVVQNVIKFLELPQYEFQKDWPLIHVGQNKIQMPSKTLCLLREFYQSHNQSLYQLLDYDFGWQ
jgi:Sulfotransferase domain